MLANWQHLPIDNTFRNILTKLQPIHGPRVWASVIALCIIQGYQSNPIERIYRLSIDEFRIDWIIIDGFIDYRLDWISSPVECNGKYDWKLNRIQKTENTYKHDWWFQGIQPIWRRFLTYSAIHCPVSVWQEGPAPLPPLNSPFAGLNISKMKQLKIIHLLYKVWTHKRRALRR